MYSTSFFPTRAFLQTHAAAFRRRGGGRAFTLLELLIALAIFMVVMLVVGYFGVRSASAFVTLSTAFHHNSRAVVVMDRLVDELMTGNFASLEPAVPVGSEFLSFQKIEGVDVDTPIFGARLRVDSVPLEGSTPDGWDDNGNGLVDEFGLRIWEDRLPLGTTPGPEDAETVLCGNLVPGGLLFTRRGGVLIFQLTFQKTVERGLDPVRFTVRTAVSLRNEG